MNSAVLATRAVTSEYARQLLRPLLFIWVGVFAVIFALIIWAAVADSPWWLILAGLPALLFAIGFFIWLFIWRLMKRLSPTMNQEQRAATKRLAHTIGRSAENIGTPRFLLVFRIVKDVTLRTKRDKSFVGELVQTPGSLRQDFENLRKLF